MKYDFTRCNNLQFKANVQGIEKKGYLKVWNEENVCMFYSDENKAFDASLQFEYALCSKFFTNMMDFNLWVENHDLEIIPRDPETYTDWKVGDKVISNTGNKVNTIIAVLGKAIVLVRDAEVPITMLTTADDLTKYNKLILTDYEKELICAQDQEEKQKECPFKEGDKVLVRDFDSSEWRFAILESYNENCEEPYRVKSSALSYRQCIPLNEHTWKLLGTTDGYKATNNNESH